MLQLVIQQQAIVLEQQTAILQLLSIRSQVHSNPALEALQIPPAQTPRHVVQTPQHVVQTPLRSFLPPPRTWPHDLQILTGKELSDLMVRFVSENLAAVPLNPSNRPQSECMIAMLLVGEFVDMQSITRVAIDTSEAERKHWTAAVRELAVQAERALLRFLEDHHNVRLSTARRRKRTYTGYVSGILRAWGALPEKVKFCLRLLQKLRFEYTPV